MLYYLEFATLCKKAPEISFQKFKIWAKSWQFLAFHCKFNLPGKGWKRGIFARSRVSFQFQTAEFRLITGETDGACSSSDRHGCQIGLNGLKRRWDSSFQENGQLVVPTFGPTVLHKRQFATKYLVFEQKNTMFRRLWPILRHKKCYFWPNFCCLGVKTALFLWFWPVVQCKPWHAILAGDYFSGGLLLYWGPISLRFLPLQFFSAKYKPSQQGFVDSAGSLVKSNASRWKSSASLYHSSSPSTYFLPA